MRNKKRRNTACFCTNRHFLDKMKRFYWIFQILVLIAKILLLLTE
jgi:hypothetical protein